jgi:hypothetical protein
MRKWLNDHKIIGIIQEIMQTFLLLQVQDYIMKVSFHPFIAGLKYSRENSVKVNNGK